jgi:predicted lipoprotein with Yx(FWY)xxD motif
VTGSRLRLAPAVLVLLAAGWAAGCGSSPDPAARSEPSPEASPESPSASPPTPDPSPTKDDARPTRPGTKIIVADSDYGPMLYDGSGQPIYLFTAETGSRPACYDACADDWPPVLTDGKPAASGDARSALLGTVRRTDGRTQVTYDGQPLYFYAHEGKYEVLCHDVEEYGGTWLVVRPDGTAAPA